MARPGHDPYRLIRFVGLSAADGVAAGWTVMLALIWLDIGDLGTLLQNSDSRELITAMMAGAFGITFAFLGIAWGMLIVFPDHED